MALTESLFDIGPPEPCPEAFNMAAYVFAPARTTPEKTALTVLGPGGAVRETWSFAELDRAVRATATGLRAAGLRPGERVALRMGNVSDFPILFFATIAAGGIAVPTAAQLTEAEFAKLAADMRPRLVAMSDDLALAELPEGATPLPQCAWAELRRDTPGEIAPTTAEDPAILFYTSGTGGRPKGVLHAQRAAWARRMMWQGWYGLGSDDIMLHAGAFNWTYTLGTGLTDPWAAGASTLIYDGPRDAGIWPLIAREHGATIFAAVPGVYRQLLRAPSCDAAHFASLRHGLTAGERLPETMAAAWDAQTGKPLYEALGMSEISTYVSSSPTVPRRPGKSGRPQPGRRVAVLDDAGAPAPISTPGRLAVSRRDPGMMLGYWHLPEATAAAQEGEWFLTGDRAEMDEDGYLTFLGRMDEVMTSLGYRVAPQEVEEALAGHPGVAEVASSELPVRGDLSLIAAFIVPRGEMPAEAELQAHAAETLAPYKMPRIWIEVSDLPRTANGKLLRRELQARYRRDEG